MNIPLVHPQQASRLPDFWASEAQFRVVKPMGPEVYPGQAALRAFCGSCLKVRASVTP